MKTARSTITATAVAARAADAGRTPCSASSGGCTSSALRTVSTSRSAAVAELYGMADEPHVCEASTPYSRVEDKDDRLEYYTVWKCSRGHEVSRVHVATQMVNFPPEAD